MSSVDDYISTVLSIKYLNISETRDLIDVLESPWVDRIKKIANNLSRYNIDNLFLIHELKLRHFIRDTALINFSKEFIGSSFSESKITMDDKINYSNKPRVVLGVHDYFQVFTAYKLSLMLGGVYTFVEDSDLVPDGLSRIFRNSYGLYNKISNGGVIVETGGQKKPYELMRKCIDDKKSVFATIDMFSNALKNVINVEGELGEYKIVSGVIEYYINHGYEFYCARTIMNEAGKVCLYIDELTGGNVTDISKSYIGRLEYYNILDPLGWEGFLNRKF